MRDGRVVWSAISTVVSGLLGWAALAAVGRTEGPVAFATFSVVWGLFFGIGGAFAGLQQEVTRATSAAARSGTTGPLLVGPAVLLGTVPVLLVVGVAFAEGQPGWAAALGLGLLGLGVLTFISGGLAAAGRWGSLAALMGLDATLRAVAVVTCLAVGRVDLLPWAIAVGCFAWMPLLLSAPVRHALNARGRDTHAGFAHRALFAMASTGTAALLVAGFPLLVSLTRPGDPSSLVGVLLATLVLVRAPVLVVLYGFRPVLLGSFLDSALPVRGSVLRWWVRLAAIGLAAVAAAALIGPAAVRFVFGSEYSADPVDLAVLTTGAFLVAMLVISGLALVSVDRHTASLAGWLAALTGTVVLLVPPESDRLALLLACAVGPAFGLVVHAWSLSGDPTRSAQVVP